jgi:hypothetical protein
MDAAKEGRYVAMAAARDINDELTIIINGATEALAMCEVGDPARIPLLEISACAQRCAFKTAKLLTYASRAGMLRPSPMSLEMLIDREGA